MVTALPPVPKAVLGTEKRLVLDGWMHRWRLGDCEAPCFLRQESNLSELLDLMVKLVGV